MSGEVNAVTPEMTAGWSETYLPTILSKYELKDIYNANEFGLFFQALPNNSLHYKDERSSGGKHSKVRLAGSAAGNATGEKLPLFVIGQSATFFQWCKKFTFSLSFSKKELYGWGFVYQWVKELDQKFAAQDRNIASIVDNCPVHSIVDRLKAIALIFLPSHTTSRRNLWIKVLLEV